MGLDCSHGCWHGPYSSFDRFRQAIARASALGDLDQYDGHSEQPNARPFPDPREQPLVYLLNHSDCDGSIPVEQQEPLRRALLAIYDTIEPEWRPQLQEFTQGLAFATADNEPVEFH